MITFSLAEFLTVLVLALAVGATLWPLASWVRQSIRARRSRRKRRCGVVYVRRVYGHAWLAVLPPTLAEMSSGQFALLLLAAVAFTALGLFVIAASSMRSDELARSEDWEQDLNHQPGGTAHE